jgi:hypothetical protein
VFSKPIYRKTVSQLENNVIRSAKTSTVDLNPLRESYKMCFFSRHENKRRNFKSLTFGLLMENRPRFDSPEYTNQSIYIMSFVLKHIFSYNFLTSIFVGDILAPPRDSGPECLSVVNLMFTPSTFRLLKTSHLIE